MNDKFIFIDPAIEGEDYSCLIDGDIINGEWDIKKLRRLDHTKKVKGDEL